MFKKDRGFDKTSVKDGIAKLISRYECLIFDNALNPNLLKCFRERLEHAQRNKRNPEKFLQEEDRAFRELEAQTIAREQAAVMKQEARRRMLNGETFADKVLKEYHRRIEHYPEIKIHQDADPEVCRLYGALSLMDKDYWPEIEIYLRRALPGQTERLAMEQRFWKLVPTRKDRFPEALERYYRSLSQSEDKENVREAQEAIKTAAFFLHELLDVCEHTSMQTAPDPRVDQALNFIRQLITDFRLKDLKRSR